MDMKTLFNSGVVCHAIALADEIGIFEDLEERSPLPLGRIKGSPGSRLQIEAVVQLLELAGIVVWDKPDSIKRGPLFTQCLARKSLFTWLFHASSSVLVHASERILNPGTPPRSRNGALIGTTMGDLGRRNIDKALCSVIDWRKYSCVLDVGCGDASRIQAFVRMFPLEAIGVDTSVQALEDAKKRISSSPEAERIHLFLGDANQLRLDNSLRERVDVAMVALLAHDFLPAPNAIETFGSWRQLFPNLRQVVVCETVRLAVPIPISEAEVPSLGYEYLHALMGTEVETDDAWKSIFARAGWKINAVVPLSIPASTNIYICGRAD